MRRFASSKTAKGGILVALAALQFAGAVVLSKNAIEGGLPLASMLGIRFAIAAAVMGVVAGGIRAPIRTPPSEVVKIAGLAIAGVVVETFFFLGVSQGTASAVTLLFFTYPIGVALLSVALRIGVVRPVVVFGLFATVVGAGLVITSSGGIDISPGGVAFALGAAGANCIYLISAEMILRRTPPISSSLWLMIGGSVLFSAFALIQGDRLPSGPHEWLIVMGMGLLTVGALVCLFGGVRLMGSIRTAIISTLEPLATAFLAMVFLGEVLHAGTIFGGLLIVAGATVAALSRDARHEVEIPIP